MWPKPDKNSKEEHEVFGAKKYHLVVKIIKLLELPKLRAGSRGLALSTRRLTHTRDGVLAHSTCSNQLSTAQRDLLKFSRPEKDGLWRSGSSLALLFLSSRTTAAGALAGPGEPLQGLQRRTHTAPPSNRACKASRPGGLFGFLITGSIFTQIITVAR